MPVRGGARLRQAGDFIALRGTDVLALRGVAPEDALFAKGPSPREVAALPLYRECAPTAADDARINRLALAKVGRMHNALEAIPNTSGI